MSAHATAMHLLGLSTDGSWIAVAAAAAVEPVASAPLAHTLRLDPVDAAAAMTVGGVGAFVAAVLALLGIEHLRKTWADRLRTRPRADGATRSPPGPLARAAARAAEWARRRFGVPGFTIVGAVTLGPIGLAVAGRALGLPLRPFVLWGVGALVGWSLVLAGVSGAA